MAVQTFIGIFPGNNTVAGWARAESHGDKLLVATT